MIGDENQSSPTSDKETVGFRRRRADRLKVEEVLGSNPLIVGLDLAKRKHAAWLTRRDGVPLDRFMVEHSLEGITSLVKRCERERQSGRFERVIVFMETTSHFWCNVANALEAHSVVYRTVAPLAVHRQREIMHLTFAKGDYRDSEIIARLGIQGNWLHRVLERGRPWTELSALTHEHENLLEAAIAERQRIYAFVELVLPEFFDYFQDTTKKTARAILRALGAEPTPRTLADVNGHLELVQGARLNRGKLRQLMARLDGGPSYGVERFRPSALKRVGLAVDRLDLILLQRKDVQERLVQLYLETPYHAVLDTIPAVSQESHALLLGLIGDPTVYGRGSCLAKYAGTEPRENHSGDKIGSSSISRRGVAPLRHVLYRITSGLHGGNAEFGAYIRRLRGRQDNPLAWNQALVAAGNKYLRMVRRLCLEGRPYDPKKIRAGLTDMEQARDKIEGNNPSLT